ncbi:hypothetical protein L9F63_017517, partial [Diploptera punctata]
FSHILSHHRTGDPCLVSPGCPTTLRMASPLFPPVRISMTSSLISMSPTVFAYCPKSGI